MSKSLYLINPKSESPSYFGAEVFESWGFESVQAIADLATTTVAALAPPDWEIEICDEYMDPVDFDHPADFVGITGKITQARRMKTLAETFRERGKTVIFGGPFASLSPDAVRDHCDILVVGELEDIAEEFFSDLETSWKSEYVTGKPDLLLSPLPRWDLYNNRRALTGCVQTSRGCPFECEFCDVIQYLGRKQRHKSVEQILAECDALYELGYRDIFLADDNFTVYRRRAKEVLSALRDWNAARTDGPVAFCTQVSIDATRDPDIMRLQAEAGMVWVFVGIETPNVESLKETKKRQNVGVDLVEEIQVFLDHGISVRGGMIVGFDHDDLDIFDIQYRFAMQTPIPIFSVGSLVAPAATPLFDRMKQGGRLVEDGPESVANPWQTNMVPSQMTLEQLLEGVKWLANRLYLPENFAERMVTMIESMGPQRGPFRKKGGEPTAIPVKAVNRETMNMLRKFVRQGPEERKMWKRIFRAMSEHPESEPAVMRTLFNYAQVRCLYENGQFWEPQVSEHSPFEGVVGSVPVGSQEGLVTIGGASAS